MADSPPPPPPNAGPANNPEESIDEPSERALSPIPVPPSAEKVAPPSGGAPDELSPGAAVTAAGAGQVDYTAIARLNLSDVQDDDESEEGDFDVMSGGDEDDDDDEELGGVPAYMALRIDALRKLDDDYVEIRSRYAAERAALEAKYGKMVEPLFDKRCSVLAGECDDKIEESGAAATKALAEAVAELKKGQLGGAPGQDDGGEPFDEPKLSGVPQFWVCAMGHCEPISELITENDVDCLEHLVDVRCEMHMQMPQQLAAKVIELEGGVVGAASEEAVTKVETGVDGTAAKATAPEADVKTAADTDAEKKPSAEQEGSVTGAGSTNHSSPTDAQAFVSPSIPSVSAFPSIPPPATTADAASILAGFTLYFHFDSKSNPYFTESVLTKRYVVPNMLEEGEEPMLKECTGCAITWKKNMSLTHRTVVKKQRAQGGKGKRKNMVRTVTQTKRTDSFFHFFNPPPLPGHGPGEGDMDEEEIQAIEDAFDRDWDVATAVRCQLVTRAVTWFTGEALDEDLDDDEVDMYEDEDEDSGDGDGGADGGPPLNFSSPIPAGEGPAGGSPFPPGAAGDGENPECKQN